MSDTQTGVLVAVFNTNMVGSDEPNMQSVHVFDREEFRRSGESTHEFARPHLEEKYGTVENLRIYPTRIRSVNSD